MVTSVTATSVQGTFNVTFDAGTLTGSFDVPICGTTPNAKDCQL